MSRGKCPLLGWALSVPWCSDVVNRNRLSRSRVLHFWPSSRSWMTAQSLSHIAIGRWRKKFVDCVKKNPLPWQRHLSDHSHISQQSSTPVRPAILYISWRSVRTFWNNWARTNNKNWKQFWHLGSPKVIKSGTVRQCLQCFDAVGWVAGRASGL